MNLTEKNSRLEDLLRGMGRVLVAFSGGVDSSFLLKKAVDVLGDGVLAATGVSATYTREERERAEQMARAWGVRHVIIETDELADARFAANPADRCYFCKSELFRKFCDLARAEGIEYVLDANNADDLSDYRPGRKAAQELGVRSPLIEAELTKEDIRALSREMKLTTWDLPASACLASRFPYGQAITEEGLRRVEEAEKFLRTLGFRQLRVRSHGNLARIEVPAAEIPRLADPAVAGPVTARLKELGYVFVTLDLRGYRIGSMNEALGRKATAQ